MLDATQELNRELESANKNRKSLDDELKDIRHHLRLLDSKHDDLKYHFFKLLYSWKTWLQEHQVSFGLVFTILPVVLWVTTGYATEVLTGSVEKAFITALETVAPVCLITFGLAAIQESLSISSNYQFFHTRIKMRHTKRGELSRYGREIESQLSDVDVYIQRCKRRLDEEIGKQVERQKRHDEEQRVRGEEEIRSREKAERVRKSGLLYRHFADTDWNSLSGIEFEKELNGVFNYLGYESKMTSATNDMGADLIVKRNGCLLVVQAKRYATKVGSVAVTESQSAMVTHMADQCAVITNNKFTRQAKKQANKGKVKCILVEGSQLMDLIDGKIEFGI